MNCLTRNHFIDLFYFPMHSILRVVMLNLESFTLECIGRGDIFDRMVHASGTEIKAITYSAMEIKHQDDKLVEGDESTEDVGDDRHTVSPEDDKKSSNDSAHIYVIVDI